MGLEKINTRVVVYNDKSILNNFISPLVEIALKPIRWITNGKTYYITLDDQKNPSTIYKDKETTFKIILIGKKIFGIIATIFLFFPIGLALLTKAIILSTQNSKKNYAFIETHKNFPILVKNNFSKAPKNLKPTKKELNDSKNIDIKNLLDIWDKVGKDHSKYQEFRNHLSNWLKDIPNPNKYTFINEKTAPYAAKQLERDLKLLIHLITNKNIQNDKLEATILNIYDKSTDCSPTWLEVTSQEYHKYKGGTVEERILRYIQQIKEEVILNFVQEALEHQWHSLSYMRQIFKRELGLGKVLLDTVSILKWYEYILISLGIEMPGKYKGFSKKNCRILFYKNFSHEVLIKQLENKINMDTLGACDDTISTYLESQAIKLAKKEFINVEDDNFDSALYVYKNFYNTKKITNAKGKTKNQFLINYEGASAILLKLGLLDYA